MHYWSSFGAINEVREEIAPWCDYSNVRQRRVDWEFNVDDAHLKTEVGLPEITKCDRALEGVWTMTRRSRGREVALQVLYQIEQNPGAPSDQIGYFIKRRLLEDRKICGFTEGLVAGVKEHQRKLTA